MGQRPRPVAPSGTYESAEISALSQGLPSFGKREEENVVDLRHGSGVRQAAADFEQRPADQGQRHALGPHLVVLPHRVVPLGSSQQALEPLPLAGMMLSQGGAAISGSGAFTIGNVLGEGIHLFGGASLTRGFSQRLERAFGFPVKVAENPLTCVAEGAARCLRTPGVTEAYGWS